MNVQKSADWKIIAKKNIEETKHIMVSWTNWNEYASGLAKKAPIIFTFYNKFRLVTGFNPS